MSHQTLVDPELIPFLEAFPPLEISAATLPALRLSLDQLAASAPLRTEFPVAFETVTVEATGGAPSLKVLCYRPVRSKGRLPAILQIHGGGYVIGSAQMMDGSNRQLAAELNCAVFSVEYRLAPETPHPGPVEDCYAALKWLHENAAKLEIDARRICVKGESAGGGLAAGLCLLARDRREFSIAFQHLIYPMIDDRSATARVAKAADRDSREALRRALHG
jgi:triacylglycerol lipase